MIFIYDNNEDYSAHELHFIDGDKWPRETIERAIKSLSGYPMAGYLVGEAEDISWYEGESEKLWKFFSAYCVLTCRAENDWGSFPADLLAWLLEKYPENSGNGWEKKLRAAVSAEVTP
jgi:hypothetical protein